jgi:predicted nuclease of predicted toxin-antitoxin system
LIDDCLHRVLAQVARDHGYDAAHITTVGMASTPDKMIAERAVQTGAIMVTNDARDYRRLYARFVSHPGLVIMLPSVGKGAKSGFSKRWSNSSPPKNLL